MRVAVLGTGYVGLVTGVCLAKVGHDVICVDMDRSKVERLNSGDAVIYEPGLAELMREVLQIGRLRFGTNVVSATAAAEAIIIAVGTPTSCDGFSLDMSPLFAIAAELANGLNSRKTVIVKSTASVGATRKLREIVLSANPRAQFDLACNPEFLRQGCAIQDFMNPDRIIIGTEFGRLTAHLEDLYASFSRRGIPVIATGIESAELTKIGSNTFLAAKVAFINELAALCEKSGADIRDVARGMGLDERIGSQFLNPGPGFGGSCFPKDTRGLIASGKLHRIILPVAEAVMESNERTKRRMLDVIAALAQDSLANKKVVVFGITFKADTDDIRESPALVIVPELIGRGADVWIVDPQGRKNGEKLLPLAKWEADPYEAVKGGDILVILTEWAEFRSLDLGRLAAGMRHPSIADLRNMYDRDTLKQAGFLQIRQTGIA